MEKPKNLVLEVSNIPMLRQEPILSKNTIVFTNDGSDDITTKPQANPPINMQLMFCDDTQAVNYQQLLSDILEYEDDMPYISENLPKIVDGNDPNWTLTDVRVDANDINLGLTNIESNDVVNLHLSGGTFSFAALFQCQQRAILIEYYNLNNCESHKMNVYRYEDSKLVNMSVSVNGSPWEVSTFSRLPS